MGTRRRKKKLARSRAWGNLVNRHEVLEESVLMALGQQENPRRKLLNRGYWVYNEEQMIQGRHANKA